MIHLELKLFEFEVPSDSCFCSISNCYRTDCTLNYWPISITKVSKEAEWENDIQKESERTSVLDSF